MNMINNIQKTILHLTFLFAISLFPSGAAGFSYEYFSDTFFTSIHVLRVDPREHAIVPVRAGGEEIKRETVTSLAKQHGAVAALNGGFWKLNGDPAGILKINGKWLGTPVKPRGAIGWSKNGQFVVIDRVMTNIDLKDFSEDNKIEVIPVSLPPNTSREQWDQVEHIVGGTPLLIHGCHLIEDYHPELTIESFLTKKHPRTAVGLKSTGEWVFVVVDGRFNGVFGGMTIRALAEFMLDLGCVVALNLDGGGSSTMVINGKVINEPCGEIFEDGKYVEAVSDAILILETTH